ncbi:MAG TPA: phosphatidate cytidylyltransferase [Actinomycetota bacterium]|nr:phosphatidate cytidylyltransferase [Actinomycetota bacterium]
MPEGEERTEGEDLFEDLDKFFAPIQDVDWPEPSRSADAPPERPREPEREPERDPKRDPKPAEEEGPEEAGEAGRGSTMAFETTPEDTPDEPDQPALPADEGEGDEGTDLFADEWRRTAEAPDEGVEQEEADEAAAEAGGGVGSYLFETEAEELEGEEGPAQRTYVELPDDRLSAEDEVVREEAPDLEAVEAAADHLAESVRDEVQVESPALPEPTEEVAIAALLEDDEEASAEDASARTVRVGGEGFGGPSWQEPTAIEVGGKAESEEAAGRNVPVAFLTGIVLVALAIGTILLGPGPFAIYAGIVVLFAQGEFYLSLQKRHYQPATALGLVAGALVLGAGYYRGENAMLAIMALSLFGTFLWFMAVPAQHRHNIVANIALSVLGIAYIPLLAAYALAVLKLPDGEGLALAIIGLTFVYDTAAFGVGYFWGSRPLAPNISPKKSWEGAIGATLVTIAVAVGVVAPSVTLLDTVGRSVGLAVVVAIFAPLGDLAESLLKRDLGIKDMGGILPGHGGVMDRIDSVLFVAPAAFIYLRLILL